MEKRFITVLLCLASWCIASSQEQKPVMWPIIHRDYVSWVPLPMEKRDSVVIVSTHVWRSYADTMIYTKTRRRGGMISTARQDENGGVYMFNENYTGVLRHERWEDHSNGRILVRERHYTKDGNQYVEWTYKNKR